MHRLTAVLLSLSASAALACVGAPICIPLAPGDRLNVPANAPAFVAPMRGGTLTLSVAGMDGGVRELDALPGSVEYAGGLYAPGPIASGQMLTLQSSVESCGAATPETAVVTVLDPAPFPSAVGDVVLGEATGYLRPSGGVNADCSPESQLSAAKRSVSVILPDDALPWLSVLRVKVNGSSPAFGHLARSVTQGRPTLVGEASFDCNHNRDVVSVPLSVVLELPGRAEVVRSESMIEVDCSVAPPAPSGCSSVPALSLGVLALWLRRRRSRLQQRSEDEAIE